MHVYNNTEDDVGYIARSQSSLNVMALSRRVAKFSVPTLITGETGTGKEHVARYIHHCALGDSFPYIAVNCAALPESMIEAILFGHVRGAFTGAHESVKGKFEQANGGTLLLDEIGDMPLNLQSKLLRVLQEQEIERIGSHKRIPLNIRLIASTNKNLDNEVAIGNFREDLFYRISVVPIHISPLRERPEDILPLTQVFIKKYQASAVNKARLSSQALQLLERYSWPGNVRELENVIQRGIILCDNALITPKDLALPIAGQSSILIPTIKQISQSGLQDDGSKNHIKQHGRLAEYQYIIDLLRQCQGNKSKTAQTLGITTRALRYRLASMRQNGIGIDCCS
ncbi:sigma-54 interaction domain-containing protein [Rouxiella sp. WC2420]|uniref:Sigma-54 interaction domain-containing protein n=1 Tax=Rouxiella sp. WC2420 TaxID=3234145 RepID=A0AB39VR15_9GAMM